MFLRTIRTRSGINQKAGKRRAVVGGVIKASSSGTIVPRTHKVDRLAGVRRARVGDARSDSTRGLVQYVTRNAPRETWALIAKLILDEAFAEPTDTPVAGRAQVQAERRQSLLESLTMLKAGDAGKILAPRAGQSRTLVKKLRDEGKLLALPLGRRPDYHYPAFQFDTEHHQVKPIVVYANVKMGAADDPWGVAAWWRTPSDVLDGRSPLDELEHGDLTEIAVDNIASWTERVM